MEENLRREIIRAQQSEITEHLVYRRLAQSERDPKNRKVLERIALDEKRHYDFWASQTGETPPPRVLTVQKYTWIARLLGLTFAIKLMEKGEEQAQSNYADIMRGIPGIEEIIRDEQDHENELTNMIDEERLLYVGSIVLGLNDALVELTGALAGFTLALRNGRLIAVIGLITGIAAALSMAISEYLSTKTEQGDGRSPIKAAVYTGIAYLATVALLIAPYLLFQSPLLSLACTLANALAIILAFSFYISVARDEPFWPRFSEMAFLSLGVATVSFGIGFLLRNYAGIDL